MNKLSTTYKIAVQIAFLIAVVALAFYLATVASNSEVLRTMIAEYGYVGIFVLALLSGFNIVVPIPVVSFMPLFLESGLSFWITIALISLGMSCADALSFILARAGKRIASESEFAEKILTRFQGLEKSYYRYPLAVLFIFASVAPFPNEVLLIPAAFFLGYRLRELLPIILAGNLVFNILFAKGLLNLFNLL